MAPAVAAPAAGAPAPAAQASQASQETASVGRGEILGGRRIKIIRLKKKTRKNRFREAGDDKE